MFFDKIPGVLSQLFAEDMLPGCRNSFSISDQIINNFKEEKKKIGTI